MEVLYLQVRHPVMATIPDIDFPVIVQMIPLKDQPPPSSACSRTAANSISAAVLSSPDGIAQAFIIGNESVCLVLGGKSFYGQDLNPIACSGEIAYRNGWLSDDDMNRFALCFFKNTYGEYLTGLLKSGSDE